MTVVSSGPIEKPTTAIMFIGNIGAGKSTLLSHLGGDFLSGIRFMEGLTKQVSEQIVTLNGQRVVLMDIPGLYEADDQATKANAKKLTEALRRGYDYKLFFVLMGGNRGLTKEDLALMSTVNKCIRQANGARVAFRVIINQINDRKLYSMYDQCLARDNFRTFFDNPNFKQYELDIQINSVLLIRFYEDADIDESTLDNLMKHVEGQEAVQVKLVKEVKTVNDDLKLYAIAAATAVTTVFLTLTTVAVAVLNQ
ncbi:hypothetical protein B0O80DRAFT_438622 [Mortierella sp. GBAus27b]|nr:hypothetical protein B0O80DRAFT_438622 [Mortierella sp. GBAus27b]